MTRLATLVVITNNLALLQSESSLQTSDKYLMTQCNHVTAISNTNYSDVDHGLGFYNIHHVLRNDYFDSFEYNLFGS